MHNTIRSSTATTSAQSGPHEATVRVGPLSYVPVVLSELGLQPQSIFDDVGMDLSEFEDTDTEISYLAASRLLADCLARSGCAHFGLLVGRRAGPSSLGVTGFMLHCAPDVGSALKDLVKHLDLHDQGGVPTLRVRDRVALLGYAIHHSQAEASDQIYDLAIALGCNIMRSLCGPGWNPSEVRFSRRPPPDLSPYRSFFRAPLRFNASHNALAFASRWLDHRVASADPLLHRFLQREAERRHALRPADFIAELRALLRSLLLARKCSLASTASRLCLHERTLNRRLREHGTTFRRELDSVRCELAAQLLCEGAMPLSRIAATLNYADTTAFSRAFKRWTGSTPAQWRAAGEAAPPARIA